MRPTTRSSRARHAGEIRYYRTERRSYAPLFALAAVGQLQTAALAKGLGDLDQTATIQVLEDIVGLQVRQPKP